MLGKEGPIGDGLIWEICRYIGPKTFSFERSPLLIVGGRRKTKKGDSDE
jgi:hypothetical protein